MNVFNKSNYKHLWKTHQVFKIVKYFIYDVKYCCQRMHRGWSDYDATHFDVWFINTVPSIIEWYKVHRHTSPLLDKQVINNLQNYLTTDMNNDEAWDIILDAIVTMFKESSEEYCTEHNEYEEQYLQSMELTGINKSEYETLMHNYIVKELKIQNYRNQCRQQAFEILSYYFNEIGD